VFYLFSNNSLYHDVHHDVHGIKTNYSQPFFTFWDKVMGTYMDPAKFDDARKKKD
jgi:sphinganine C4-monooxygenase